MSYLVIAYLAAVGLLGGYVAHLLRRRAALQAEIDALPHE